MLWLICLKVDDPGEQTLSLTFHFSRLTDLLAIKLDVYFFSDDKHICLQCEQLCYHNKSKQEERKEHEEL